MLSVTLGVDNASLSSSLESLEDSHLVGPADSLLVVSSLPDGAFVGTSIESLDNSGTSHGSSPGASSESACSSSIGDA